MSPADADSILERVLAGDLDADAPEVRELVARDPAVAAELAALRTTAELVERVGAEQRADREEASRSGPVPGEDDAVARARALAGAGGGRVLPFPVWRLAAAAAVLLVVLFGLPRLFDGEGLFDERVLGDPPRLLHGASAAPATDGFAWESELPPGGRFDLVVRALDDDAVLLRVERLEAPVYVPVAAERALLAEPYEWEVLVREAGGTIAESARAVVHP